MKFADFVQRCQQLLRENPETSTMKVFNTSVMDSPQRFVTSGVYVGSVTCEDLGGECERFLITGDPDVALLEPLNDVPVQSFTVDCVVIDAY